MSFPFLILTHRLNYLKEFSLLIDLLIEFYFYFILIEIGAYNYGYEVSPDGQFHHETRGPDGVTYGCYGFIDQDNVLRATHYVADMKGYRTVEALKPVLVYPNDDRYDFT